MADDKKPPAPRREGDRQTGLVLDERTRTKKPPMYKVLLHNDDYTTMEFVVHVLEKFFHMGETEATRVMLHVHHKGYGIVGPTEGSGMFPWRRVDERLPRVSLEKRCHEKPRHFGTGQPSLGAQFKNPGCQSGQFGRGVACRLFSPS
jgi:hypothetical protein